MGSNGQKTDFYSPDITSIPCLTIPSLIIKESMCVLWVIQFNLEHGHYFIELFLTKLIDKWIKYTFFQSFGSSNLYSENALREPIFLDLSKF